MKKWRKKQKKKSRFCMLSHHFNSLVFNAFIINTSINFSHRVNIDIAFFYIEKLKIQNKIRKIKK
jgi:hypothetical protein